jgi:hypothetical protein
VLVVAALALVFLGAHALGTGGTVDGAVAAAVAGRGLAALAAGAVLGVLGSRYAGVARRDPTLVLVALVIVAAACGAFGLEATLVGLAAGVAARNAGGPGAVALRQATEAASLPVQVVWFAISGAALRVDALAELWPWAVLLVGLRVVALRYGSLWAGRDRAVPEPMARRAWLGLVSQAGIALALAAAARRAFPAWGVSLEALIAASVVLNELAGPVCWHWALQRERAGAHAGGESGGTVGAGEWTPRPVLAR